MSAPVGNKSRAARRVVPTARGSNESTYDIMAPPADGSGIHPAESIIHALKPEDNMSPSSRGSSTTGPPVVIASWRLAVNGVVCGIINNAAFCVLLGASQDIAGDFASVNQVSLLTMMSTLGSVCGTFLNSLLLVGRFGELTRLKMLLAGFVFGYFWILLAYWFFGGEKIGFWLSVFGAFLLGNCSSAGEVANLSVYRQFDPKMLSSWGAGTGLSGIIGPFLYILLTETLKFTPGEICYVLIAALPVYFCCFWCIVRTAESDSGARASGVLML